MKSSLWLVKGDKMSKEVTKLAEEKDFRGNIFWITEKEAAEQRIGGFPRYIATNGCSVGPDSIIAFFRTADKGME